ncbi:TonB-dependent receptor family protein [Salinibacter altiplanensis]|uniref:TonB-dependent receptor family protein n=1 Tax=Salinibacter altiplanensis TaxID=1803181 RepID=UPI000C9F1992|nr:TonB-dependent receptor [Salinibacter altiplanensis]
MSFSSVRVALLYGIGLALLVGCLLHHSPSHAQAPPDTSVAMQVEMAPVEVTATPFRIANEAPSFSAATRTRPDQALNSTPSLSLEQVSAGLPGLSVQSRTHFALGDRITIRGLGWRAQFGVRGIQMLLDGIPLTTADGQSVVHIIDPSFVRSLELVRGPASTFWGNASGGVLSLSTRPPRASAHTVRLKETVGSYGLSKTDVQVTPDLGAHQLSVYSSYLAQDGFRQHSETRLLRSGGTGNVSLGEDRGVRIVGALQHMPQAQSPGSLSKTAAQSSPGQARPAILDFDVGKDVTQGQLGATYYDDTGAGTVNATVYGLLRDLRNPIPFNVIDLHRRAGGVRLTLEDETPSLRWGVGLSGKLQHDDRREFTSANGAPDRLLIDQLETVDNEALFGRLSVPLGRLQVDAGLRYDRLQFEADDRLGSDDGTQAFRTLSPALGLSYETGPARLFANLSTGLEAPTTTELSNRPDGEGGFNDLDAESVVGIEGGATGTWPAQHLSYDLALFYQDVDDVLVPFELPDETTAYRNQGAARHRGAEISVRWQPPGPVSVQASHSFVDAEFTEGTVAADNSTTRLEGNQLPGVPSHRFAGTLRARTALAHASASVRSVSEQYGDTQNTATNDGYTTVDMRLSHPGIGIGGGATLTPFLALNNAFDVRYNDVVVNAFGGRFYEPAAGRHWRAGTSLQF